MVCKIVYVCLLMEGSAESPGERSGIRPHEPHPPLEPCWQVLFSKYARGESCLTNQFLEGRGPGHRMCTCPSMDVS